MQSFGCFRDIYSGGVLRLGDEARENFRRQLFGYGWEWVQTHEIDDAGCPKPENYYLNIFGAGPKQFYFESETNAVCYFHSDANNKYMSRRLPIAADTTYGRILFNPQAEDAPFVNCLDIFCIQYSAGTWHIACVEHLAQRSENGVKKDVWGWSEYKRMPPQRLAEIQKTHSCESGK